MTNKKVYLIGTGLILLAGLIVVSLTVLPIALHKAKMSDMLDLAMSPTWLSVGDPLFETGDVLGNKGKEVLAQGEDLSAITAALKKLSESGFRTGGTQKMSGGTLAMSVKACNDAGEIVILYFEEAKFYYMDNETAVFFEAKNTEAYGELYQKLISCLAA
ncbi:MAG: hypothetical protein J6A84_03170 [Clostridia bacterium]|nr:hypothetical protein [Clostridia bacterium]